MNHSQKGASGKLMKTGIVVVSILVLFISFEIILRSLSPIYLTGYIGAYQYDKELGYRLKDNVKILKTTDYQQEIITNKLGTVNFQNNFDGYQILVFTIGDSFTQGTGLPSDASYPLQLDLLLNMESGRYIKKYAVVNIGLAAFGGEQNLLALKRYAQKLGKPNYILYLGCNNDYQDDLLFKSGYRHKHLVDGSPYWGWYLRPLMWLSNETEIGKRVKVLLGNIRRSKIFGADEKSMTSDSRKTNTQENHGPATGTWNKIANHRDEVNEALLEKPIFQNLIKISQDYGGKLIVSWMDNSDGSYQWLKEYAEKNHIAFADWYPAVESVCNGIPGIPLNNPHSGGHYRTWVNGQIARAYARQISSMQNFRN